MSNTIRFALLFTAGLLATMMGVGGVDNSQTDQQLVASTAVSGLGLLMMYLSTHYLNKEQQ